MVWHAVFGLQRRFAKRTVWLLSGEYWICEQRLMCGTNAYLTVVTFAGRVRLLPAHIKDISLAIVSNVQIKLCFAAYLDAN